jgi:hypothetical protein
MKLLLTWVVILYCPSLAQASDNTSYKVAGFVNFEAGKTEFKSCIARIENNSIKITAYSFDLSKEDINAYRSAYRLNKYNRPIKEMEADNRHKIPLGYERHPQIYIGVEFEDNKNIEIKYLEKISVGFGGGGKKGNLYIGLHPDNFKAKIESLSKFSITGEVIPEDVDMSFHIKFTCPILN